MSATAYPSPIEISSPSPGTLRRYTAAEPCPICGGHPNLRRGHGIRCAGFALDAVAYCTRDEHAGRLSLDISTSPPAFRHRLFGDCGCGVTHGMRPPGPSTTPRKARPRLEPLPITERDTIYAAALALLPLRAATVADLTRRGLTQDQVESLGYRSIPQRGREVRPFLDELLARFGEARLRRCPGFLDKNDRLTFWSAFQGHDGYVVPYRDEHGRVTGLQLRLLDGRHLTARGTKLAGMFHMAGVLDPGGDLYLTEGATKANVAHALGAITVLAVAGQALQDEHVSVLVGLRPGRVIVALDQEANANTAQARARWITRLQAAGLSVWTAVWEGADVGGPKGLDDCLAAGEAPRLRPVPVVPAAIGSARIPHPVPVSGPVDAGEPFHVVRSATKAVIADFVRAADRTGGSAQLVASPPGTGKTTAVATALRTTPTNARIVVGTQRLARELADTFGYALVAGRAPENCARFDVVGALARDGHDVARLACGTPREPRCPQRDDCPYWAQFRQAGPRVGTAEQLYNPRFLRGGRIVIIDDADPTRACIERVHLNAADLVRAEDQLRGRRREPLRRMLRVVQHALLDAPRRDDGAPAASLIGPAVWDHLARTARRNGERIGDVVRTLPRRPTVPRLPDDGPLTVADVERGAPATVLRLAHALRDELDRFESGGPFNSRLRLGADGVDVWTLREHATDRHGNTYIGDMGLLLLDATPVAAVVDHLTADHRRAPDLRPAVTLPPNVTIVQYADSTNGHAVLGQPQRRQAALAQIAAERRAHPVPAPADEAVVAFKRLRAALEDLGFAPAQVLHFGATRGTNALAAVQRLHVLGRPMPPSDDLLYLAQVIHHDAAPVDSAVVLRSAPYGGHRVAVDVVDFVDPRVAALLRAHREDEIIQVLHRARVLTLQPQLSLERKVRSAARIVLHTSHPVPGLRVDELILHRVVRDVNAERAAEADARIVDASRRLQTRGEPCTLSAIAREAGAHKKTVAKHLGTSVHTVKRDLLNKGVHHHPHAQAEIAYVEEVR